MEEDSFRVWWMCVEDGDGKEEGRVTFWDGKRTSGSAAEARVAAGANLKDTDLRSTLLTGLTWYWECTSATGP